MLHYLKYVLKSFFGSVIIAALQTILEKADPDVGHWWLYLTLSLWLGYTFIEYRLEHNDE